MRNNIIKNISIFSFTILLLFFAFYFFVSLQEFHRFKEISLTYFFISILIAIIIFFISGLEYSILYSKSLNIRLSHFDILTLPMIVHLWSYLIPMQGSTIFSTIFFYKKYNVKLSGSLSITIFTYLFAVFFSGIAGLIFVVINDLWFSVLFYISVLLILTPFLVFLFNALFKIINVKSFFLKKIHYFIYEVTSSLVVLNRNTVIFAVLFLIRLLSVIVFILWYKCIAISLGYDIPYFSLLIFVLFMQIINVIKITPGNLGVAQITSAAIMALIGDVASKGPMITLFASFAAMVPCFTIGLYAHIKFLKETSFSFNIEKILDYFKKIKK